MVIAGSADVGVEDRDGIGWRPLRGLAIELVIEDRAHRAVGEGADLALARGDGRYARIMPSLNGAQLLILDDWGLDPLDAGARRDLYEILEERYGGRSTILTSQVPIDKWHQVIADPTYADAILDRLVHNAHRIDLAGDSLRRIRRDQPQRSD